jgi:hypothetical protein
MRYLVEGLFRPRGVGFVVSALLLLQALDKGDNRLQAAPHKGDGPHEGFGRLLGISSEQGNDHGNTPKNSSDDQNFSDHVRVPSTQWEPNIIVIPYFQMLCQSALLLLI